MAANIPFEDSARKHRIQIPYDLDNSLLDTYGSLSNIRLKLLDVISLAQSRASPHFDASRLRFLVSSQEGSPENQQGTLAKYSSSAGVFVDQVENEERQNCSCWGLSTFPTNDCQSKSMSKRNGLPMCACDVMEDPRLTLTTAGALPYCKHYVAVSYCWEKPQSVDVGIIPGESMRCTSSVDIVDKSIPGDTRIRPTHAPPHILRRATRYAASKKSSLIWIDQECIRQDDRVEKEAGIQSMDRVYSNSKYPVGILTFKFSKQEQINAMALLLSDDMARYGTLIMDGVPWQQIIHTVPGDTIQQSNMLELLNNIVADRWFSRSWITQETICSSDMVLTFEYDISLDIPENIAGISSGEIIMSLKQLLDAIWWSFIPPIVSILSPEERENLITVFFKVYPTVREKSSASSRYICTMFSAWQLLKETGNSRVADRLAIIANLCDYPVRINSVKAEAAGFNLELCIICQALLNGDIDVFMPRYLATDFRGSIAMADSQIPPSKGPWLSALSHYSLARIGAGYDSRWKPAYFAFDDVTERGIVCRGVLWKVCQNIPVGPLQRRLKFRNWVESVGRFMIELPSTITRLAARAVRRLALLIGFSEFMKNSNWLLHPRSGLNHFDIRRREQLRSQLFLKDMIREFSYSEFCKLQGLKHDLEAFDMNLSKRFDGPLDNIDEERLSWLKDRVEACGSFWGATVENSSEKEDESLRGIFDCAPEVGSMIYVFTPHSDRLQEQPAHSVNFRAHSWIVEMVEPNVLRCKDLIYGIYDYGAASPAQYTLVWD